MIELVKFLKAAGVAVNTDSLKIHLACWNGTEHPLDRYYAGTFKSYQDWQGRLNFNCDQVLGLIDLGKSSWLFAGVYKILGHKPHPQNKRHFLYSSRLLPSQDDMIGRIIVHHKRSRNSRIWYRPEIMLPITEIRREKLTVEEFPGYNSVLVSHSTLKTITEQQISSWHAALSSIKGIYLITDTSTGKLYVGKASGTVGIWQRWCSYASCGHGGNIELKRLLKQQGPEHASHFQFSILEIADTHASDNDILYRESYWISALKSREFGLNGCRKLLVPS